MTNIEFRYFQCRYYNCTPKQYEEALKYAISTTKRSRYKTRENWFKKVKERLEIKLRG